VSIQSRTPAPARRLPRALGTPELAILGLIALLALGAIVLGGDGTSSPSPRVVATSPAHVRLIERRVEALRDLRFKHPVPVAIVSPAQARREGLADFDRSQPPAQRRVNEELLKLLGLLPRDADLRRIEGTVYGEQVAGYYDPRRKRLALVRGAGVDDVTLAHELTHALEDQYADLAQLGNDPTHPGGDDASTAQQALVEGSATEVMERYAERWPSDAPLGDALSGLTQVTSATPLPQYVARTLVFPYFQGQAFIEALLETGGDDWKLVDVAERTRPPTTTAEILHPSRWLRAEQSEGIALTGAPGPGWRRLTSSTLGEEDLAALLSPSIGPLASRQAGAHWRGGRYALWRRGPVTDLRCPAPCRARDALQLSVRVDAARSARPVAVALSVWLTRTLHARRLVTDTSGGLWRLPGGSFGAVRWRGRTVRAALAPGTGLALRLAGG
jgi:hypothetical protein